MISEFEKILNNSSDLKSVEMILLAYLEKVRKIEKRERIGLVSGSVFSDGEEYVKRNIEILHNRTEKVRKTHNCIFHWSAILQSMNIANIQRRTSLSHKSI